MCPVKAFGEYILRTGNAIWRVLLDGWEDVRFHDSEIDARVRDGEERRFERYVWASWVLRAGQSPPLQKARGEEAR
jgi:hypothetical protein